MIVEFSPIGIIHSPYKNKNEIPCQGVLSDKEGKVEVYRQFEDSLTDVEGYSHLYLIYYFHKATGYEPLVKPFLDDKKRGLFATRHYNRPNPIGLTIVNLIERKENMLIVRNIDMLDKTPLLDIKPYVPQFDQREGCRIGWLEANLDRFAI